MDLKSIEPIVQQRVNAFYAQYHRALEQQHLMEWVDMLDPNVSYRITSRENLQRGWPLCFVRCDNQGMAHDRACALLSSIYFVNAANSTLCPTFTSRTCDVKVV